MFCRFWPRWIYWYWSKYLQDIFKRSFEDVWLRQMYSSWSRRLEDVLKTSFEDKDKRHFHQDECLLGWVTRQVVQVLRVTNRLFNNNYPVLISSFMLESKITIFLFFWKQLSKNFLWLINLVDYLAGLNWHNFSIQHS